MNMTVDVLAIGPHPDDVELFMGGTLLKMAQRGYQTAILDLTRGELSTRGCVTTREAESQEAANILQVSLRLNAQLPDGGLCDSAEQRLVLVRQLRRLKPKIVFAPWAMDHHPDHVGAHSLVKASVFLSGLPKFDVDTPAHRISRVVFYPTHVSVAPSFVVDVSEQFAEKRQACEAYKSQFFNPVASEPETYISRREFWSWWEARFRQSGQLIAKEYGESFLVDLPVPLDDPVKTFCGHDLYPQLKGSV